MHLSSIYLFLFPSFSRKNIRFPLFFRHYDKCEGRTISNMVSNPILRYLFFIAIYMRDLFPEYSPRQQFCHFPRGESISVAYNLSSSWGIRGRKCTQEIIVGDFRDVVEFIQCVAGLSPRVGKTYGNFHYLILYLYNCFKHITLYIIHIYTNARYFL